MNPGLCNRDTEIIGCITNLSLNNMSEHFRLSRYHKDGYTWKQTWLGKLHAILADCRRDFLNVQIHSPRSLLSDHEALIGWIQAGPSTNFKGCLRASKSIPWTPPTEEESDISDYHFACL